MVNPDSASVPVGSFELEDGRRQLQELSPLEHLRCLRLLYLDCKLVHDAAHGDRASDQRAHRHLRKHYLDPVHRGFLFATTFNSLVALHRRGKCVARNLADAILDGVRTRVITRSDGSTRGTGRLFFAMSCDACVITPGCAAESLKAL